MIYYFTPYEKGNLGRAYNNYCKLVPDDNDWITFIDGDIMQLHTNWGDIWSTILNQNDDAGIVTCLTNRASPINNDQVMLNMYNETNIISHKIFALKQFELKQYSTKIMTNKFLSGFFFSFKKSTWKKVNGFIDGILNVDSNFYNKVKKINKECLVSEGFYVLHYYRFVEGWNYVQHLKQNKSI